MFLKMFEEDKQRVAACSTATQQCSPHFPLSSADILLPLNTSLPRLLLNRQRSRPEDYSKPENLDNGKVNHWSLVYWVSDLG